jgi:ribosomal protein S18 acetylase RimI-like enzyme
MNARRIPMEFRLRRETIRLDAPCRPVRATDRQDLAILLYAAYHGTIDDEGETFADALAEIDKLFAGGYGEFLANCSFVTEEGEFLASACLITWWPPHDAPLVAFTMTRPAARKRGLARNLLQASMNALLDAGYERLTLIVTDGNAPARRLYASLGFREIPPPRVP